MFCMEEWTDGLLLISNKFKKYWKFCDIEFNYHLNTNDATQNWTYRPNKTTYALNGCVFPADTNLNKNVVKK